MKPKQLSLFKFWDQVLKNEGLEVIGENPLPQSAKGYFQTKGYFDKANHALNTYDFKSNLDFQVWSFHCQGKTLLEIQGLLPISRSTAGRIIHSLRKNFSLPKNERAAYQYTNDLEIKNLRLKGCKIREIAEITNQSIHQVKRRLNALGLTKVRVKSSLK